MNRMRGTGAGAGTRIETQSCTRIRTSKDVRTGYEMAITARLMDRRVYEFIGAADPLASHPGAVIAGNGAGPAQSEARERWSSRQGQA